MLGPRALLGALLAAFLLAPPATSRQSFEIETTLIPNVGPANDSFTENVDFGDVDLDGDWDAIFADGGDDGNDQNRIWVNQGGAQAGLLGEFFDETTTRFPLVQDDSRDIEFVDLDADGDLDVYVSNTSQVSNQSNRWWINEGGTQGGTTGFYVEDTASRWIGLAGAGSSVAPSAVLPSGGFVDWSCDCDFGDLDDDGDMDLVHSSYGGAFSGKVPTRLFLNDGAGFYSEFNPSGHQLAGNEIADGEPGLWCEGTQQANTTDTTGAFCDIATTALDVDIADIDGDFDLDLLHGSRTELPRMFNNRLQPAGFLTFRDVTGLVFPPGYSFGIGHYEQELGDLDDDGDLDIYGLNWQVQFGFHDVTLENDGNGIYSNVVQLAGSQADDTEGDFLDYDNDGDLDLYVGSFSAKDRLYRNDFAGAGFSFTDVTSAELPVQGFVSLDCEACDVDGDGDYDVFVANDKGQKNRYMRNLTQVPDTTAPRLPKLEAVPASIVAAVPGIPVRAHVLDNAPYYVTWYNPTFLDVVVDGCALPPIPAASVGGQVFRGVLPGNLVGSVDYGARSSDEYGNTGSSAVRSYTGTTSAAYAIPFGAGSPGSLGVPQVRALSVPFPSSTLYLGGSNAPPGAFWLLALTDQGLPAPLPLPGLCTINVAGNQLLFTSGLTDANGCAVLALPLDASLPSGASVFAEFFVIDGVGGNVLSSSPGLEIVTQ